MKMVADSGLDLVDLVDLKMLPAWVNEPTLAEPYSHIDGEERTKRDHQRPPHERRRGKRPTSNPPSQRYGVAGIEPAFARDGRRGEHPTSKEERRKRAGERFHRKNRERHPHRGQDRRREDRHEAAPQIVPQVGAQFLPHPRALENVIAQIKADSVAYSLFALARLFLEKPQRYDVRLTTSAQSPLLQLGENGAVSVNRHSLERNAFRLAQSNFYKVDITQGEPVKGNFTNVARCKLSGTLLGPTNHHDYQKRLRNLYEQRFSRRMSFAEYQRQIEILTDSQLVEQWKEEARKLVTFTTLREETPATFTSASDAERHFRETYLPGLIQSKQELIIDGVASRSLSDRILRHLIEAEWVRATRSPSGMMQELASQFRQAALHVFRHRRGMLFVSPIRIRSLTADAPMSPLVQSIIENLRGAPGIGRKELADKLITNLAGDEAERAKLALASDLRWLINEGHVIEFNDGSLDLPRGKAKAAVEAAVLAAKEQIAESSVVEGAAPAANEQLAERSAVGAAVSAADVPPRQPEIAESAISLVDAEIGGS